MSFNGITPIECIESLRFCLLGNSSYLALRAEAHVTCGEVLTVFWQTLTRFRFQLTEDKERRRRIYKLLLQLLSY